MLTGCAGTTELSDPAPETAQEAVEETAEEPVSEEETTEVAEENTEETAENDGAGLANPWKEITEDEAAQNTARLFIVPEGAQNVVWKMMESGENPLIEADFTLDGLDFIARTQYGTPEYEDISGVNYEWTVTDEGKLGGWGSGNMDAKFYRYVGDVSVDLCTWYDIEIGISYSLSTSAADLDGFDIQAVAEAMYPGDEAFYGDF